MRTLVGVIVVCLAVLHGSESVDLLCDFIPVRTIKSYDVSGNLCKVVSLEIININDTITSVNGQFAPLPDLNIVHIFNQPINHFPKGLDKFFPNLEAIQLLQTPLKSVEQSDVKPFGSKLKKFLLGSNQIEHLDGNLFEYNSELRWIGFDENKLKTVGKNLLKPLTKLQRAYFDKNECIDKAAMSEKDVQALADELEVNCKAEEDSIVKSFGSEITNFFSPIVDLFTHNDVQPAKEKLQIEDSATEASVPEVPTKPVNANLALLELEESTVHPDAIAPLVIFDVNGSNRPDVRMFVQIICLALVARFFSLL